MYMSDQAQQASPVFSEGFVWDFKDSVVERIIRNILPAGIDCLPIELLESPKEYR